jgi:hypothetical protein
MQKFLSFEKERDLLTSLVRCATLPPPCILSMSLMQDVRDEDVKGWKDIDIATLVCLNSSDNYTISPPHNCD